MGRSRSRRRSRSRPKKKPQRARSPSPADSDITGEAEPNEEVTLEARVTLLEVEIATLKAENRELKKKLLEALKRVGNSAAPKESASTGKDDKKKRKKADSSPEAKAPVSRRREPEPESRQERRREPDGRKSKPGQAPEPQKVAEPEKAEPEESGDMPAWASPEKDDEDEEDAMRRNAVQLTNSQMECYNESIPNNIPLEKRLPLVKAKLDRFMEHFDEKIGIYDLNSGGAVIRDRKMFQMRYQCVFRESGAKLKGTCTKRFYFDATMKQPTYCLDFETHESLVTAQPGTRQDGSLGCRPPRTEHLCVLYKEEKGRLVAMWLAPDKDKLGQDSHAGDEVVKRHPLYKQFEKKISELKGGGPVGPFHFFNYHDTPTVG